MKDKQFKKQRRRVRQLMDKWRDPLRLFEWEVVTKYSRGAIKVDGEYRIPEPVATAKVQWEYRHLTITWDLDYAAQLDDRLLETIFVHECCHALVAEMREWSEGSALDHEERVCQTLAMIIVGLDRRKSE